MSVKRRGTLFVVSAPSGAGKTTLCRELRKRVQGSRTRLGDDARAAAGETHGVDFDFVDQRAVPRHVARASSTSTPGAGPPLRTPRARSNGLVAGTESCWTSHEGRARLKRTRRRPAGFIVGSR